MPRGRHPKPASQRQNRTKKAGRAELELLENAGAVERGIPNPDQREWHPLTIAAWQRAWRSPMASHWLETDADALGRLALLWDAFYKEPDAKIMAEIRLQESRFGLSPLDRSRLQWEVTRAQESERRNPPAATEQPKRTGTSDPRRILMAVK